MPTTTVSDTFTAIEERRSIKKYDPNFQMPQADLDKLMELTLLSPTSFNIQNWRFVVVTDLEQKKKLRAAAWNQAQLEEASAVVAFCADLEAANKQPERYWRNAPEAAQKALIPMIGQFYGTNTQLQRDEAMRSTGIAGQTFMLAAKAMGYDTCPMVGFDPKQVAEIINLPSDHLISMLIVVGKALEPARERGGQLDKAEVVFRNSF